MQILARARVMIVPAPDGGSRSHIRAWLQTPGRRSNSDPIPEPSEVPLPMSHSTSAAGLSARSDGTGPSGYMSAAPSVSGSLPSEVGRGQAESAPRAAEASADPPRARSTAGTEAAGEATEAPPADHAPGRPRAEADMKLNRSADTGPEGQESQDRPRPQAAEESAAAPAGGEGEASPESEEGVGGAEASSVPRDGAPEESSAGSGCGAFDVSAVAEALNGVEAEHSPEWRRQPKHVFVLTSAGVHAFGNLD